MFYGFTPTLFSSHAVCSSHAYGSSEICHNRPEMNTMAPKFRSASNTRFAALVRGWFRIAFHNIN